jgi:hypothetical protein
MTPDLAMPLRYLIGVDEDTNNGKSGYVTECNYDITAAPRFGQGIKYGNLFYEKYRKASAAERERYAPYLHTSDTAEEYHEGQIDPKGLGWYRNLDDQFDRAKSQQFHYIELDNPDAYHVEDVLRAVDRAWAAGLYVIAKNPILVEGNNTDYLKHPAVVGCVVEQNCGTCNGMDVLRRAAYKPLLPVWFVSFGGPTSLQWARKRAAVIKANEFSNMSVSWCSVGEYENVIDIYTPTFISQVPRAKPSIMDIDSDVAD